MGACGISGWRPQWGMDANDGGKIPLIEVWRDAAPRDAAEHMAVDEALFRLSREGKAARARFYTWTGRAVTVGYFHDFAADPVPDGPGASVAVRRMTGGGLVEHGKDVTFSLILPAGSGIAGWKGSERYRWIHSALARALNAHGIPSALAGEEKTDTGPCFAHPVFCDVVCPETGRKIAGGAQRRSGGAVIHQGSVRVPPPFRSVEAAWTMRFLEELAAKTRLLDAAATGRAEADAEAVARTRYRSEDWNRRGASSPLQ